MVAELQGDDRPRWQTQLFCHFIQSRVRRGRNGTKSYGTCLGLCERVAACLALKPVQRPTKREKPGSRLSEQKRLHRRSTSGRRDAYIRYRRQMRRSPAARAEPHESPAAAAAPLGARPQRARGRDGHVGRRPSAPTARSSVADGGFMSSRVALRPARGAERRRPALVRDALRADERDDRRVAPRRLVDPRPPRAPPSTRR